MSENNFNPRRTVLIGDTSQERSQLLEEILRDDFHLQTICFQNFYNLMEKVKVNDDWLLALVADDLHLDSMQKGMAPHSYFIKLEDYVQSGCLVSGKHPPDMTGVSRPPHCIYVPRMPASGNPAQRETTIAGLKSFDFLPQQIVLPRLELTSDDRTLREQLRSLSEQRHPDEGREILRHLTRWFFDCDNTTIEKLGQGLSGARVFLLQIEEGGKKESYVLKLSPLENLWKLEEEVRKHQSANGLTGIAKFKSHLAPLHLCLDSPQDTYIARYKNWAAVCYGYLGDKKFGKSIDLETLLVCSLNELSSKIQGSKLHHQHFSSGKSLLESRRDVFNVFLNWLSEEWCLADDKAERDMRQLWLTANCPPKQYPTLPPYQLKGKEKGQILSFLDGKDAEKVSRLLPSWDEHRSRIWGFIEKDGQPTDIPAFDNPVLVILSPAHGDLNAKNAMLWLEHPDHPLLIDFPSFQESGHALQDFARLEIEIIYALMDCQAENAESLKASDHTHTQLDLWIALVDQLLDENGWMKKAAWKNKKFDANAKHCLDLIQLLRHKAELVQGQCKPENSELPKFFAEYLPALLYYTLKEIGYESRTVFKRLLAVYCASKIISQVEQLPLYSASPHS